MGLRLTGKSIRITISFSYVRLISEKSQSEPYLMCLNFASNTLPPKVDNFLLSTIQSLEVDKFNSTAGEIFESQSVNSLKNYQVPKNSLVGTRIRLSISKFTPKIIHVLILIQSIGLSAPLQFFGYIPQVSYIV